MDRTRVRSIVEERLTAWGVILVENHATPLVVIGVGHDHRSGEIQLCRPEGDLMADDELILLLERTAALLRALSLPC